MSGWYVLKGRGVVPAPPIEDWHALGIASWNSPASGNGTLQCHIGDEKVGDVRISTVFLGLDHGYGGERRPVVFETMIFGGMYDGRQERCVTLTEAEAMHEAWVARVRDGQRFHNRARWAVRCALGALREAWRSGRRAL